MDYRRYKTLMEQYKEAGTLNIDDHDTKESLIKKLMDSSYEKKQISTEVNSIIRDFITKYEKEPELLNEETAALLNDFLNLLKVQREDTGGSDYLDPSVSLCIARLLLRYYQSMSPQDPEQIIPMLQQCAVYDLIMKNHRDDYESTPYSIMAERYLGMFDSLSDRARRTLIHIMTIGGYNLKDLTFGLQKFIENRDTFMEMRRKLGEDDFHIKYYYTLFKINALAYAVNACFRTEAAKKRGATLKKPLIDLEKYASLMDEFRFELLEILASDEAKTLLYDRVSVKQYIAETDYYLGRITFDELLSLLWECTEPQEDYSPFEKSSALLTGIPDYLDYLCRCSDFNRQYVQDRSIKLIKYVLESTERSSQEQVEISPELINNAVLQMTGTASGFLDFEFFKRTVLNITVYANKELYVHTMMVREIALVLLDYILDHDPEYLDGVAGFSWEYCRDHKDEIMELMENCALLHDIGKYFCLDFVNNSSRSLTNDEWEIIKEHPTNFSKIYKGGMGSKVECIRDCAELHHLWFDESGGYPQRSHTANKPFVNIITIADCIDAATDNIGRPYCLNKTLDQVAAEIDAEKDTRYSGRVGELLHIEEIQHKIDHAIKDKRQDIYCDIYLRNN